MAPPCNTNGDNSPKAPKTPPCLTVSPTSICELPMHGDGNASVAPNLRARTTFLRKVHRSNGSPSNNAADDEEDKSLKLRMTVDRGKAQSAFSRMVTAAKRINSSALFLFLIRVLYRFRGIVLPILCLLILHLRLNFRRLYRRGFGKHPFVGGMLGMKLDHRLTQYVIDETYKAKHKELSSFGVELPQPHRTTPTNLLQINTNAALRELLLRREKRAQTLIDVENAAEEYQLGCLPTEMKRKKSRRAARRAASDWVRHRGVPKIILSPADTMIWHPPRMAKLTDFTPLTFDQSEMRDFVEDNYLPILGAFDSLRTLQERIQLWAICALYYYGGVFVGDGRKVGDHPIDSFFTKGGLFENLGSTVSCASPVGVAVFQRGSSKDVQSSFDLDIVMIAATPRHPHIRCIMNDLEFTRGLDASRILSSFFHGGWESSTSYRRLHDPKLSSSFAGSSWEKLTTRCFYGHAHTAECCESVEFEMIEHPIATLTSEQGSADTESQLFVQVLEESVDTSDDKQDRAQRVSLDVREREGTEVPVKSRKRRLETLLRETWSEPGWICSRCLKTSLAGSFEKCRSFCSSAFEELMCRAPDDPEKAEVVVEVTVNDIDNKQKHIPRIIHQTWFEPVTPDRYPQLARLQNSWKNSGWDYRFYTDEDARNYIVRNFPSRFVDAFDALIPGAYKADLFRYLVLLKEGGIYADIDIMLDTTLDTFITPNLSFFAPRDVVGEYADEAFCLWNGMIGAAPGHPFILRAVERVMNLVLDRADMYDMERDVCRRVGPGMENWKVRAEPLLLFSGPCALGVAVNDVLNRSSLERFEIGWLGLDHISYHDSSDHSNTQKVQERDFGDALIMVGDKYDIGAFRISDPDRNFVVASTDLPGVDKLAREMSHRTRGEEKRILRRHGPLPHYSEAARDVYIWGEENVYHDDYVNNEVIKFDVYFNDKL